MDNQISVARKIGPFRRRSTCRGCQSERLVSFLDYGEVPLAGNFVRPEDADGVLYYPLDLSFCTDCTLVQVQNVVDAKTIFHDYRYLSSITRTLMSHFEMYADELCARNLVGTGKSVVEIGCNDGVLLGPLRARGASALGVDAAANVAEIARNKGNEVVTGFFGLDLAETIIAERGQADLITASNVFAHVDNLDDIMRGVKRLLAPEGTFCIEVHYGVDLVETLQFDTVYHEHLCYYSLRALDTLVGRFGMRIYDAQRLPMHGGAIRVFAAHNEGTHHAFASAALLGLLELEASMELDKVETYRRFAAASLGLREAIRTEVLRRSALSERICAFGAAGRGTTLLNFCGLDRTVLDFVIDESPSRIGRIVPGVAVPIVALEELERTPTQACLVTAWNYRDEILAKTARYRELGGEMIFPLPKLEIIR